MRKALAAAAVLLLPLAACDSVSGEPGQETPRPTPTQSGSVDAKASDTKEDNSQDVKFGQPYVYDDGVEITVSGPEVLDRPHKGETWEEYASYMDVPDDADPVKITMTIRNNGDKTMDPSLATMTVLADDTELDAECFGEGVDCGTTLNQLRPGKTVTMAWSYWLPKGTKEITVEASPSFSHDPALYRQ